MLEKKGTNGSGMHCSSSSSVESEVLIQIPPSSLHHHNHHHGLQELPEEVELDMGKLTLPSGCDGGGDAEDEADLRKQQRKSKGNSFHSSDEIMDELLTSDIDNDIPVRSPGMISNSVTANTPDADFDSAFEDSLYSGSSDDKNKNKNDNAESSGSALKIKNRRRSSTASGSETGGSRQGGGDIITFDQTQPHAIYENLDEMGDNNGEESGGKSSGEGIHQQDEQLPVVRKDHETLCEDYLGLDEYNHHLGEPELTLFEMEVSPRNHSQREGMPVLQEIIPYNPYNQTRQDYDCFTLSDPDIEYDNSRRRISNGHHKNRRVHYDETDGPISRRCDYSDEEEDCRSEDVDESGQIDTILLAPPLDMEVQLSPIGSPKDDINLNMTNADCSSQFRKENDDTVQNGPALYLHDGFDCDMKRDEENFSQSGVLVAGTPVSSFSINSSLSPTGGEHNGTPNIPDADKNHDDYDVVYVVPDGGWGWMVLFGSILVNILIPGTVKSFGILFVEFLEVFDATPTAAAWIPAISYWLYSSMGPFAGALATKYSHRSVTIVGGLLASFGLMISYFATSIPYLYISYGVIGGLGAGLAYPIGVFMVGQYFEKRRGLANGLCTSGSALGSVLVPPLLRVLLSEYGYRGAILIMGAILLNVCIGAMFYEPVSKHMKKTLVPRENSNNRSKEEVDMQIKEPEIEQPLQPFPQRQVSSPIARTVQAPVREIAASMPIAIPMPQLMADFRDATNRRGSNNGRKATFQIGHEDDSWSYQSNEVASPLAARLVKEDHRSTDANSSPNKWSFYNTGIRVRGHLPGINSNDSNPELETLIHSNSSGTIVMPTSASGAALSLSGVGASRGQSRLNLTAIPEDDDTASECNSQQMDWTYYSALPPAKQRLLRLSVNGGTQLMTAPGSAGGSYSAHPSSVALVNQGGVGLSRTLSVASNVSNSSFHYVSTIHHGSLLTAMQFDKNIPEFASTLTLKSVRHSCCPRLSTLRGFIRKLTCGLWPSNPLRSQDERDSNQGIMTKDLELEHHHQTPKHKTKRSEKLKKFIDLSLLKDGMYLIMLMSNSTTAVGYTNFIVLLPSYALALGFDKSQAASLLSIVAAFDFVGRIGGAALSDLQVVSRKWYYIVGLFFSGVALSVLPCARTYAALVAMCSCFGLASGTYIGVTAVILADQLGAEKLGSSYGISLFLNGLLQLIGPPVCGALYEYIGKLEPILTGLGITLIMGALLWIFAPFIERRRARKEKLLNMQTNPDPGVGGGRGEGMSAPVQIVQNQNVTTTNVRSETSLV